MTQLHEKSVTEVLEAALNAFQDAHDRYWTERLPQSEIAEYMKEYGPPEDWYRNLKRMAKEAYQLAQSLSGESLDRNYELQQAIESSPIYLGIPSTALQVHMAREFAFGLEERVRRVQRIADLALRTTPSPKVRGYLGKLGRCYIAGFDTECVILCRSIFEAALADRLKTLGETVGDLKLQELIDRARRIGLLDKRSIRGARKIQRTGNRAVHEARDSTVDVYEIVTLTHGYVSAFFELEAEGTKDG